MMEKTLRQSVAQKQSVSLVTASKKWAQIGLLSFGGPAAQIALMHQLLVEQMRWFKEKEFVNALSFCMLLPEPEAMQLATYSGWRMHGKLGGFIAGLLFVLPGAIVILILAMTYSLFGDVPFIKTLFLGVKAAVLVVVIESLLRIANKALKLATLKVIALLAFIGIFFFNIPYPLIVLSAALFGFFYIREQIVDGEVSSVRPKGFSGLIKTVLIMLCIWWVPVLLIDAIFYEQRILLEIGLFFSRLAVVTFGGAYAVLAYMGQDVVNHWGWLTAGEMMDGLGLAETTPGPLILVTEFVGFLAAYREGGLGLGIAGAMMTLWVTFVPCFLWVFAGAPYIEWICAQPKLKGALTAISAAVVGVILNLSVWFGLHVMFLNVEQTQFGMITLWQPQWTSIDWKVALLTLMCGLLTFQFHWSIFKVLITSSMVGIVMAMLF